jgi:CubicO group peptidase (beta-lactamase class C family)
MAAVALSRLETNRLFQKATDTAIRDHGEVGLQVAVYHENDLVVDAWGGIADETTGRPVDGETLFPVFSVVKAVTATALHIQAERGLLAYDQPIARYWPEFAAEGKAHATIRDALSHRLGIPQMPAGVTPELMSNYEWMVDQLAKMKPRFAPGTDNGYMCYTFGWVIAECVRRTDPQHRPFGTFVQEEIGAPLGITDLWVGIPDRVESRVARIKNSVPRPLPPDLPIVAAIPPQVATIEEVWGRPDVRRACIPGANGIMNARSAVRIFAMLANGGVLNGVRLLSEERVRSFCAVDRLCSPPRRTCWPLRSRALMIPVPSRRRWPFGWTAHSRGQSFLTPSRAFREIPHFPLAPTQSTAMTAIHEMPIRSDNGEHG